VAFQNRPAAVADAMAVLLQTGRDLEFIGDDVLAQAMRITATGFFFGWGMREAACAHAAPEPASRTTTMLRVRTMFVSST
jgi:hypothetical protein